MNKKAVFCWCLAIVNATTGIGCFALGRYNGFLKSEKVRVMERKATCARLASPLSETDMFETKRQALSHALIMLDGGRLFDAAHVVKKWCPETFDDRDFTALADPQTLASANGYVFMVIAQEFKKL